MPHTFSTGRFSRYRWIFLAGMTVSPAGFFHLEPILAIILFGPSPTEKVKPSSTDKVFLDSFSDLGIVHSERTPETGKVGEAFINAVFFNFIRIAPDNFK